MNFRLSSNIETNKIFLTHTDDLEDRLDPYFYQPLFRKNLLGLLDNDSKKLRKIAKFSNEIWDKATQFDATFPYIEIGAIDLETGRIKNITELSVHEAPSRARMIARKGDILISTTRPSRGAIALIEKDDIYVASTGFSIIRSGTVNKKFLFYCLRQNSSLLQMAQRSSGGNYPAITQEELGKILIPMPSDTIQTLVISKMDTAYANKERKEEEAQRLFDGIDDYLLGELGIELPALEENTIQNRMFTRQLSEISGGRFDASYHFTISRILEQKTTYKYEPLKRSLRYPSQYGASDIAITPNKPNPVRYIRITDIDKIGDLKNNDWKTVNNPEEKYYLNYNDLLFARTGSIGRVYIHKNVNETAIFAGYLIRFVVDESKINPDYLFFYCHSTIYKLWIQAIYRPSVQPNINASEYENLPLVLPPLHKQIEIANHIARIRAQAKNLREEAKTGLEHAKREVEALILRNTT